MILFRFRKAAVARTSKIAPSSVSYLRDVLMDLDHHLPFLSLADTEHRTEQDLFSFTYISHAKVCLGGVP
jgi:hypothetical protein